MVGAGGEIGKRLVENLVDNGVNAHQLLDISANGYIHQLIH